MFIDTSVGFINLDHVLIIERAKRTGDNDTLHTTTGKTISCRIYGGGDDEYLYGGTVTPAAPGTTAIYLTCGRPDGKRPTEDDLWQNEEPIIAWRDCYGDLTPIRLQQYPMPNHALLLLPVGSRFRELAFEGASFDNLDEARQHVLAGAQEEWDRQQRKANACSTSR